MIKAVSRQILEVSETGNVYFGKAWLMVNPDYASASSEKLQTAAADYLQGLDAPSAIKSKRFGFMRAASFLAAAAGGGLVTAVMLQLY